MADFRLLARTHGFMKLAEIIIALICLILIRTYSLNFGGDVASGAFHDRYNVGLVTVGGMLLVSLPLLISYLWSTSGTYQPFLEIIYNTLGFILFLTVGSLALDHYRNYAGVTQTGNDNRRGDMNDWFGPSNTTQSGTGIDKAFGLNTTDNITAGKALGSLCIINAFFYLTDAALALRQGSTV
ncbi:uncharacterized protein LOC130694469 [Daphnia carinata]|uniref:uncharacterized protein LOC130694469 n=1 Tax=Daphnia carinata TaxID=120202 RepID=UPI00257F6073|nr:uncharacterized protein LOC130694469 [Daphnia carinata]